MSEPSAAADCSSYSVDELVDVLRQAAQVEHLLANQYLYAAFSMKKYPEEFGATEGRPSQGIWAQVERNRRWEAKILFTARQEMEHLALVQNLLAILDQPAYLWRANYPVPAASFPLCVPFHLLPFRKHTIEIFRYYEKPDSLALPDPFADEESEVVQRLQSAFDGRPEFVSGFDSVQSMYECVEQTFLALLLHQDVVGTNPNRVVNEHFGFNIQLEPVVQSDYAGYVSEVISLIIEQGEGVGQVPPPLGSHFMAFQSILDGLHEAAMMDSDAAIQAALPTVENPALDVAGHCGDVTLITNSYTREVAQLFNDLYVLQLQMLSGFFNLYDIDQTTGIRPPHVNAYFRTTFYPNMTNVMRPLGEMLCRLPAFDDYVPEKGALPSYTAGPTFEIPVAQGRGMGSAKLAAVSPPELPDDALGDVFVERLHAASRKAGTLADGFPWDGFIPLGGTGYRQQLQYLSQNLWRMAANFDLYWCGEIVAPIPSRDFMNLPDVN